MNGPRLRPRSEVPEEASAALPPSNTVASSSASPQPKRRVRPGWKATIVRAESFARLRAIQKSTNDPVIDLSYLADACLELALELGPEAIVKRAVSLLRPTRSSP